MKVRYRDDKLEKLLIAVNSITAIVVAATFLLLYGFDEPVLSSGRLHIVQVVAFFIFAAEKIVRFMNTSVRAQYLKANWFEIPLFVLLLVTVFFAKALFPQSSPGHVTMLSLAVYLIVQVVLKVSRSCVNLAASGRNPTGALVTVFLILIITGALLLSLPRSNNGERISAVDALFTATSATCVTGLTVRDTGRDFTIMGQIIILSLIQLGGLGIVIFGAILALLLGQALGVRESVAMQDLLNAQTLGRIGNLIAFIFITTLTIEAIGAVGLFNMWNLPPSIPQNGYHQWFYSIFHSISAFCNAGFGLYSDSLVSYNKSISVYAVIAPLIVLGGVGFGVLYNIATVATDRIKRLFKTKTPSARLYETSAPQRIQLQTKIVVTTSLALIIVGTAAIMAFGRNTSGNILENFGAAVFQSITARTAGFNTIDISSMTSANRLVLIVLMLIGGSPSSTAGGVKTVTLAVVVMVAYATLRKRNNVEVFRRSVNPAVVGRAITVMLLFAVVFLAATFLLGITERANEFDMGDIMFESASALGTVGLSTGITPSLTTAGKLIIIVTMLIGRLGPLTLLAAITFNLKAVGYEYPSEPIIVG